MIRLFSTAVGDTLLGEHGLELPLVGSSGHRFSHGVVRTGGDLVRPPDQGHLVVIFDDPAFLDGRLECTQILLVELQKGDVVRNVAGDGPHDAARRLREAHKRAVDLGRVPHLIDVVLPQSVLRRQREAGPDNIFRIDRRDVESQPVRVHLVREI